MNHEFCLDTRKDRDYWVLLEITGLLEITEEIRIMNILSLVALDIIVQPEVVQALPGLYH